MDDRAHHTRNHSDAPRPTLSLRVTYKDPASSVNALLDPGSCITLISKAQMQAWDIPFAYHCENFSLATRVPFSTIGSAKISCCIEDMQVTLHVRVVPSLVSSIILGRDAQRFLPIRLFYGERLMFSRHQPPWLTPCDAPEMAVGEGLELLSPDDAYCQAVKEVILRHLDVVLQWSTRPGLIQDAAFCIPTNDAKPLYKPAIPMSQKHQSLLQAHLDDYRAPQAGCF
jgi:hypothetical protein